MSMSEEGLSVRVVLPGKKLTFNEDLPLTDAQKLELFFLFVDRLKPIIEAMAKHDPDILKGDVVPVIRFAVDVLQASWRSYEKQHCSGGFGA
jgi:hypothetical protein